MTLQTPKFDMFPFRGKFKVYVTDKTLAKRLNKVLNTYNDVTFRDGDEAVFTFTSSDLKEVLKALKIKGVA